MKNILRWAGLISIMVALDQMIKYWVENTLPLYTRVDMLPFLSLFRTYNEGVAFSALSDLGRWPLVILTIAIIIFVLWLWRGLAPERKLSAIGFGLVISGAIGNLIDRVRLGKVIDMVLFHIDSLQFQFAVFNFADTLITLGAIAIILDEFLAWRSGRKNPPVSE